MHADRQESIGIMQKVSAAGDGQRWNGAENRIRMALGLNV